MPKTIVNEYDNSTVGYLNTGNFEVVIPGFYGKEYVEASAPWDDNGIYRCTSQKDFDEVVGKKSSGAKDQEAKNTTLTAFNPEEEKKEYIKQIEVNDYLTYYEKGILCKATRITDSAKKHKGKMTYSEGSGEDETWYSLTRETTEEHNYNTESLYCLVELGNEGADEIHQEVPHYGNQIAHELLGLGYIVLYKRIENLTDLEDSDYWEALYDRSTYNFRYIYSGYISNATVNTHIANVVNHINRSLEEDEDRENGRGDAIALFDVDESVVNKITDKTPSAVINRLITQINTMGYLNKFSGAFLPMVTYADMLEDEAYENNRTLPASFHYLACAAYCMNELRSKEYQAFAGEYRGICKYTIEKTSLKLGELAVNKLEPRRIKDATSLQYAVNPIVLLNGSYYLYGNRTGAKLNKDDLQWRHFLNVRQLCCTVNKTVYDVCKRYRFDPNDDILWTNIRVGVSPVLDSAKASRGIRDYKIVKLVNARRALVSGRIKMVPIEAVEDFVMNLSLENSIDGLTVDVGEEE